MSYIMNFKSTGDGLYVNDGVGEAVGKNKLVYRNSAEDWRLADSDAAATMPVVGLTLAAISSGQKGRILLQGFVVNKTWSWTAGGEIYASGTAGELTQTAPATGLKQAVAMALDPDTIYFDSGGIGDGGAIAGLTPTRVVFVGAAGELTDDADMTFVTDTLTVTKIGATSFVGAVDFTSQAVTNVGAAGNDFGATNTLVATTLASAAVSDLTSGRVVIAGASGELGDDADLTFSGDTLTATKITTTQQTFNRSPHQSYTVGEVFAGNTDTFVLQGQESGQVSVLDILSKDGDATDDVRIQLWGLGDITDITNRERLRIRWSSSNTQYELFTDAGGTGTVRDLVLYTSGNSDQLKLNTDGSVGVNAGDLQLDTNNKIQFRDAALYIHSNADSYIDYVADGAHRFSGATTVEHSSDFPLTITRTSAAVNTERYPLALTHKTSGDMVDDFGAGVEFLLTDSGVTDSLIGKIVGVRSGDDTSGALKFYTDAGDQLALTLKPDMSAIFGNVVTLGNIATGSLPAGPEGAIAYDSTLNKLVVYTGAAWETVTSV